MFDTLLECTGVGAKTFLQGQLTCNVNDLKENQPQFTACCNIQGRVIFTCHVIMKNDQSFLLHIPASMKNIVVMHLEKYARFSKCLIEDAGTTDRPPSLSLQDILNGIPTIYPETSEQIIAQRLNLHLIESAISFKKGCYLGQEIIARLHFKSTLKHHMILGEAPSATPLKRGEAIFDDEKNNVGILVDFYHDQNRTWVLFVNAIENQHPQLASGQVITLC